MAFSRGSDHCYTDRMRSIITVVVLVGLSACSAVQKQKTAQALQVTACVVADERLGVAVTAPEEAIAYLEDVQAEIVQIRAELAAIVERWKSGPPQSLAAEVDVFQRAVTLLEDLEDLALRLKACVQGGGLVAPEPLPFEVPPVPEAPVGPMVAPEPAPTPVAPVAPAEPSPASSSSPAPEATPPQSDAPQG